MDEQNNNTEASEKSYAEARAEFLADAPDDVANKLVESEAEFSKGFARVTKDNEITDPADQQQYFAMVNAEAAARGVNIMDRLEMGAVLERAADKFQQWKASARKQAILNSSDEDFQKYDELRTRERHQRQREQLRDRALTAQERVAAQHGKVREESGNDVWSLTDEQFRAMDAKKTAVRRAAMIERGRLSDDEFRLRSQAERARRNGK